MLLIPDANSEHVAHALRKIGLFGATKIGIVTAFGILKCLTQIT